MCGLRVCPRYSSSGLSIRRWCRFWATRKTPTTFTRTRWAAARRVCWRGVTSAAALQLHNAAVCLARVARVQAALVAPRIGAIIKVRGGDVDRALLLSYIFFSLLTRRALQGWCHGLRQMRSTDEKQIAFDGLCCAVEANPKDVAPLVASRRRRASPRTHDTNEQTYQQTNNARSLFVLPTPSRRFRDRRPSCARDSPHCSAHSKTRAFAARARAGLASACSKRARALRQLWRKFQRLLRHVAARREDGWRRRGSSCALCRE